MSWMYVLLSIVAEIFWVIGLRYSSNALEWTGTIITIILSTYFIIKACEGLPSGTVYAVFTGTGGAGIVLIDLFVFDAAFSFMQLTFIGLILIGVVGVMLTTEEKKSEHIQAPQTDEGAG